MILSDTLLNHLRYIEYRMYDIMNMSTRIYEPLW